MRHPLAFILKFFTICCLLTLSVSFVGMKNNETGILGKYNGLTCFRINECVTSKLEIKKEHHYVMKIIGNNHGRKNKSIEKGTWTLDGDILTLKKLSSTIEMDEEDSAPEKFKLFKGNLWNFSNVTLEVTDIAFEREK